MSKISEVTPYMTSGESTPIDQPTRAGELPGMRYSYHLDGRNYLQWAQLARTFLKGRGKIGHLTAPSPKAFDPAFTTWDIEDSMIMSWLWSVMQPKVSKNYMFLASTKEIWETVKQTYSKIQDASAIFEIKTKISSSGHGFLTVTEYYNNMNGLWLELDNYQDIKKVCKGCCHPQSNT